MLSPAPSSDTCHSSAPGIGVEGVHRIVLGGGEHRIVRRPATVSCDRYSGWASTLPSTGKVRSKPKVDECYIRQRQGRFREILAAAAQVVLVGGHVEPRTVAVPAATVSVALLLVTLPAELETTTWKVAVSSARGVAGV